MGVFHPGEVAAQARRRVREEAERVGRGIARSISPVLRARLASQRMAIVASRDEEERPWVSLLSGPAGFIQAIDPQLLLLAAATPPGDPLAANLRARPELGLLVIDLDTRLRLRFNGRGLVADEGIFLLVDQVYGNCPKYIQMRRLVGESGQGPGTPLRSSSLDARSRGVVGAADTFFIATHHPAGGADASHRGGRPGFVSVLDARTLEFPDYPGNNMFNTLGNLIEDPRVGLLFVDFAQGGLLQLTGRAEVRWEPDTVVRVTIEEVRETPHGISARFELVEAWPGNPAVTP
jgi:predicted pyridoxine 5'-phosphate oxidase superfamily flavin-nucleotide-binding protein